MGRISRAWHLFGKSFEVVKRQKKLLVFPLLSFLALFVLLALVGLGSFSTLSAMGVFEEGGETQLENLSAGAQAAFVAAYFLIYLLFMFVANFCAVAFYSQIVGYINGTPVSVGAGFAFAGTRFKSIFLWSLLASTVGVLLKMLEEKMGFIGQIVLKLVGMAWAVASVFVIPSIVCDPESENPFTALKKSARTLARTWGESLAGYLGFSVLNMIGTFVFILVAVGLGALGVSMGQDWLWPVIVVVLGMAFMVLVGFMYVVAASEHVYRVALYLYANGRPQPETLPYTPDDYQGAFRTK